MSGRSWLFYGAVNGALAVALGAFGAHGLKKHVSDVGLLKTWETGAHYHLIHALGLFALCGINFQELLLILTPEK